MESAFRNSPLFQPTPPARTETLLLSLSKGIREYFNPLRPRGRRRCSGRNKETSYINFNPLRPRGRRRGCMVDCEGVKDFNPLRPRGRRQQYYTKKPTILHHISTIKSHHTPSNHRQPTLHTSKTVLIVQFFRCESPRKFMFASGSHQTI